MRLALKILTLVSILMCSQLSAEELAKLYSAMGTVEVRAAGASTWAPVTKGHKLHESDEIRTGDKSRAGLRFNYGKLVRLRENSTLVIKAPETSDEPSTLDLLAGTAHLFSRTSGASPKITTPEVSASIRGTEFVVSTLNGSTEITVIDGAVEMSNAHGSALLGNGEQGAAKKNTSPTKKLVVDPMNAVQWALHYPSLSAPDLYTRVLTKDCFNALHADELERAKGACKGTNEQAVLGQSLRAMKQADYATAWDILLKSPLSTAALHYQKAGIALASGEFLQARTEIEKSKSRLGSLQGKTKAFLLASITAQETIIALAQNRNDDAVKLCNEALGFEPHSQAALLACSYVAQAEFDIEGAEDLLNGLLIINPSNEFAMARKAELLLGQGELSKAEEYARKSGSSVYALTVQGFAALTKYKTEKAKAAFLKALQRDESYSDAYLGYGLALIREGDLEAGRAEIEKAVQLAPNDASYRSYLGKAYFEEEREDIAARELTIASELDEQDPTPNLYRAFTRLSKNKPVAALEDVEASIAKNDNRAVYRSRFLMDQDLAVRTTSLAEVFRQLGFDEAARIEAIKSINKDYSNYSAHRLYADSLVGSAFSDATFSENVIADILAPVSFNVFQNLRGFSAGASLNEYSALFDRPEHRTGIEASAQSYQDLLSGSVYQTGKTDRLGYLLSASSRYGEGRKQNNKYIREQQVSAAAQYQIDYSNRVLFQTTVNRSDDVFVGDEFVNEQGSFTLSSHHEVAPGGRVLLSVDYFNSDSDNELDGTTRTTTTEIIREDMSIFSDDLDILVDERTKEDSNTWRYSAQYIQQTGFMRAILGTQFLDSTLDSTENSIVVDDFDTGLDDMLYSDGRSNGLSHSSYLYTTWHLLPWLDVDAGLSFTELELSTVDTSIPPFVDGTRTDDRWSPKFGLTVSPVDNLTVRGAYFKALSVANIADIGSIEPTLVGGFSQVYTDLPGTRSENYGAAIDYKFPAQAYFGVEYLERELERLSTSITNVFTIDLDALVETDSFSVDSLVLEDEEKDLRAYAYFILSSNIALATDYQRTWYQPGFESSDIEQDRARASLRYFSSDRWYSFLTNRWLHQSADAFEDGNESIWLTDWGIGYRLPKRHGVVQFSVNNIFDNEVKLSDLGRSQEYISEISVSLEAQVNF